MGSGNVRVRTQGSAITKYITYKRSRSHSWWSPRLSRRQRGTGAGPGRLGARPCRRVRVTICYPLARIDARLETHSKPGNLAIFVYFSIFYSFTIPTIHSAMLYFFCYKTKMKHKNEEERRKKTGHKWRSYDAEFFRSRRFSQNVFFHRGVRTLCVH